MNQKKKAKIARIGLAIGSVSAIVGASLLVMDIKLGAPLFVLGMTVLLSVIVFCVINQI
jgi:hypothetical protein